MGKGKKQKGKRKGGKKSNGAIVLSQGNSSIRSDPIPLNRAVRIKNAFFGIKSGGGSFGKRKRENGIIVVGQDFLGQVATGAGGAGPGDLLVDLSVNPTFFYGTRLATLASCFERYRIRSWTFHYVPIVAATFDGSILMYPEYDISEPVSTDGTTRLRQGMSHRDASLAQVFSYNQTVFYADDPFTDLFTDPEGNDPRLTYVGRLMIMAASSLASSTPFGNLWMQYEIELFIPQLLTLETTIPDVGDTIDFRLNTNSSLAPLSNSFIPLAESCAPGTFTRILGQRGEIICGVVDPSATPNPNLRWVGDEGVQAPVVPGQLCFAKFYGVNQSSTSTDRDSLTTPQASVYDSLDKALSGYGQLIATNIGGDLNALATTTLYTTAAILADGFLFKLRQAFRVPQ